MPSAQAIRDLLPSVWRPDAGETGLLSGLIGVSGLELDLAHADGGNVMQAHWLPFSDYAPISPFVAAFRREARLPVLLPVDPAVKEHPHLVDLARLGGLLGLAPYTEPGSARERTEDFRDRIRGTVALWSNGVATREAILQSAVLALSGTPERAVGIEEFAPGSLSLAVAPTAGPPGGIVGPLMRWRVESLSLMPVAPEVLVEGVAPVPGEIDATDRPLIELFDPATGTGRGVLYDGTVGPGQVLALSPGFDSWLGTETGPIQATSLPGAFPADPTAAGPWTAAAGAPADPVRAMATGADGRLWLATNAAGVGALWQFDGSAWTEAASGLPRVNCLLADGVGLLVGHASGLARLDLFAAGAVLTPDPAANAAPAVHALARMPGGAIWAATDAGAARLDAGDVLVRIGPGTRPETETPLVAVLAEADGILHFGGAAGLFRHELKSGAWHVFSGESLDEGVTDWLLWDPAADDLPADGAVRLPAVLALARAQDTTLWIGTAEGLAQWGAFRIRGTYATRLRAFPALGTGPAAALAVDERQRLWAATSRGLLVHDGRDWFEEGPDGLLRLARLPAEDVASGWRYDRTGSGWQFARAGTAAGFVAQSPAVVTADNGMRSALHWTDRTVARLGSVADGVFTSDGEAAPAPLLLRIKPDPLTIVTGGIPALPRLTPGASDWRYLSREELVPPTPRANPAWTREGRLIPPPNAQAAPEEGRYLAASALAELERVFAFNPAARVSFRWSPRAALSVTVRLARPDPADVLPAAVLDRIFAAMDRVRPAGARIRLAYGEELVRGVANG